MTNRTSREIRLASRPTGWPTADNFRLVETEVPEPGPGQVVVRNLVMSVDPYMRGRMNDAKSYAPPYRLGEALHGGAVGEVVASADPGLTVGDMVRHGLGWREYALLDAAGARKVDPTAAPLSAYLGALGMVGLTAYVGLLDIAAMRPSDTVFVSGAAGAVGGIAGQIAKLRGSPRVVGSAGSDAKVEHLTRELGFDAAFNYKNGPVSEQLRNAAPDGIDVYFDNVGGEHLEAAISSLRTFGRAALCGAISRYNLEEAPPGPRNLGLAVGNRLTLRGFIVSDHADRTPDLLAEVGGWLREGRLRVDETVVDGIENAPDAFLGMLRGENIGKMLVRLAR
ncbi:NADP-dependent oxidoreductase [Sphaerisporangium rhizosphaerae]|uniref:NADP-dependent oxidoreductase n=1 Tax=Sphaerisporangium rhizosphaerae TaxID=2269375 RepID=A0ABW2P851_9ACTN